MLSNLHMKRANRTWISILVPFWGWDLVKMLIPGLAVGVIAALLMNDIEVFFLSMALGYAAFLFAMRDFEPYELAIGQEHLSDTIALLDRTPILDRDGNAYMWHRRTTSWLKSDLDGISISPGEQGWVVRGRRHDLRVLSNALRRYS
jgi:hypothetical protein